MLGEDQLMSMVMTLDHEGLLRYFLNRCEITLIGASSRGHHSLENIKISFSVSRIRDNDSRSLSWLVCTYSWCDSKGWRAVWLHPHSLVSSGHRNPGSLSSSVTSLCWWCSRKPLCFSGSQAFLSVKLWDPATLVCDFQLCGPALLCDVSG